MKTKGFYLQMGLLTFALVVAACTRLLQTSTDTDVSSEQTVTSSDLLKEAHGIIHQAQQLDRSLAADGLRPIVK